MKTQSIVQLILMILLYVFTPSRTDAQFFYSGGYQGGTLGSGGDEILVPVTEQLITMPVGWSGISSYLDPGNDTIEVLLEPANTHLIIMLDREKVYWPSMDINTIITWNPYAGYIIKMSSQVILPFRGFPVADLQVSLTGGWNVIPVLSPAAVTTTDLLDSLGDTLIIVKEIAGVGMYWPAMSINTLTTLNTGKAYQILVTDDCCVTYPGDGAKGPDQGDDIIPINQPWNDAYPTPHSHSIAFGTDALISLESGDVIGVFNSAGLCSGVLEVVDKQTPVGLTAFGDDFTTHQITEGLTEDEPMTFRLFRPTTNQEFRMIVDFSTDLSNKGTFQTNGLSLVIRIALEPLEVENFSAGNYFNVFPNPSKGELLISFRSPVQDADLSVYDMHGQLVRQQKLNCGQPGTHSSVQLGPLPPGTYVIWIQHFERSGYCRIIITK
ncbi:MAG TPA: T9SS type A sorting domain-containing protein [Bacteroidales bacterium]|nr:T9SS type A sorting domain-containing protein [Bacteroidales bacterium]HNS46113.1 T9SS type A sorting domain-containing protein [Bacteroidales bacterium]